MDVKTIFLDEEVDEKIYINQREGFEISDQKDKMCKLKKVFIWPQTSTKAVT
jgi:hypothetical protein